jgi:hypothetical protein
MALLQALPLLTGLRSSSSVGHKLHQHLLTVGHQARRRMSWRFYDVSSLSPLISPNSTHTGAGKVREFESQQVTSTETVASLQNENKLLEGTFGLDHCIL